MQHVLFFHHLKDDPGLQGRDRLRMAGFTNLDKYPTKANYEMVGGLPEVKKYLDSRPDPLRAVDMSSSFHILLTLEKKYVEMQPSLAQRLQCLAVVHVVLSILYTTLPPNVYYHLSIAYPSQYLKQPTTQPLQSSQSLALQVHLL